jgi:peptidoglycan/LPS O-acetylase OafA/YrhL
MNKAEHYYPELDSLRFLAFLFVLINHAPFTKTIPVWVTLSSYGWMGVDLFLCLSAFLFAKLLFVEYQEKGDINIGYFYLRRALRIWPLYFIFVGMMFVYSIFMNGWTNGISIRLLGLLTFTDNLFTLVLGYNFALLYMTHLWTISYEEQFYLVIPWALRFLYRQKDTTSFTILGGITLLGMITRALFIYYQVKHPAIWVFPFTHFESILGGLIIGLGLFDKVLKKISSWFLLLGGIIAFWLVTLLPDVNLIQWKLMLTYPLVGVGVSLILLAVMQGRLWPISVLMKNKALGYLGKISYGLYVYHLLGLGLVLKFANTFVSSTRLLVYPVVVLITTLFLTILISVLSYQILEKPFLKMKSRFTFVQSRSV